MGGKKMMNVTVKTKLQKALTNPKLVVYYGVSTIYNFVIDLLAGRKQELLSDLPELNEIVRHAQKRNDISDHLVTLFAESLPVKPALIVELGVRNGLGSTIVFERVAKRCDAVLVSVDLQPCSRPSPYQKWFFVQQDDIVLAQEFKSWCQERKIPPAIDILFIDTSHLYDHTVQEIASWFPWLSEKAKVFFHDSNQKTLYRRKDGSIGFAWNNQRGVIRALESYFGKRLLEHTDFIDCGKGWLIKHHAHCNGLTILEKMPVSPGEEIGVRQR